jgi:hypothetical protein
MVGVSEPMTHSRISWDWKAGPDFDELNEALEPFGLRAYEDPSTEGSDSFGFIISNENLTRDQLRAIAEED